MRSKKKKKRKRKNEANLMKEIEIFNRLYMNFGIIYSSLLCSHFEFVHFLPHVVEILLNLSNRHA